MASRQAVDMRDHRDRDGELPSTAGRREDPLHCLAEVMPRARAEEYAARVALHLQFGRWLCAQRVIEAAEKETVGEPPAPIGPGSALEEVLDDARIVAHLANSGIATVGALIARTAPDLISSRRIGQKSLEIIRSALAARGLKLAGE